MLDRLKPAGIGWTRLEYVENDDDNEDDFY